MTNVTLSTSPTRQAAPSVAMNDFRRMWDEVGPAAMEALNQVGQSGWYILGNEVKAFEQSLAQWWGAGQCVGVANGLDAIEIALRAMDIGPGDKVLTTPLSAFATTLAIMHVGATPVFVDVDEIGLIDLDRCRRVVRSDPAIKAMVPVHLFGFSIDLGELAGLKQSFDLQLIEDCAQSIGARFNGRAAGTVGDATATSFYPTKNLGTFGDGGAMLTSNDALAACARQIRHYGQTEQYHHERFGLNSRLDELHAAILRRALLPRLETWTHRRRQIAAHYLSRIDHPRIRLITAPPGMEPVWHLFPVRVPPGEREAFRADLAACGVHTGIHYPRLISDQPALRQYARFEVTDPISIAQQFATGEVSLPINPHLTDEQVDQVVAACNGWRR